MNRCAEVGNQEHDGLVEDGLVRVTQGVMLPVISKNLKSSFGGQMRIVDFVVLGQTLLQDFNSIDGMRKHFAIKVH